jgi:kynureninase
LRSNAIDPLSLEYAELLDSNDPLRSYRSRFYVTDGRIYLDGNSLGLASRDAEAAILAALESWKANGIDGWTRGEQPWFTMGEELGRLEAELVGAKPDEVIVGGSTTVNLHALVASFYRPNDRRVRIVADELNFPSDLYAIASQLRLRGRSPDSDLVLVRSRDGKTIDENDVIDAITDDVALVLLPSVLYRSGQLLDLERLTRAAYERDIPIGFDCSHSAGSVPHRLHDWGVDFAFWCNYKYLNAGPGAVASVFVHERHFGTKPGLAGWWGSRKDRQFDMALEFEPAPNAGAWQIGTPPILGMAGLAGSLEIFAEAGIARVREKSLAQTDYLMSLVDSVLSAPPYGFWIGTPREPARRGGHVALEHPDATRIAKALKSRGVIPDFRPPNVIRLAPIPLYTSFAEIWRTCEILREIVDEGEHLRFSPERETVA